MCASPMTSNTIGIPLMLLSNTGGVVGIDKFRCPPRMAVRQIYRCVGRGLQAQGRIVERVPFLFRGGLPAEQILFERHGWITRLTVPVRGIDT